MNYFEKSKKGISNTFNTSAAQQELKRKQELDNAVNSYQPIDTSYYDDLLGKNMAAIMTGKSNYNFAPDEVLSQYARDYSALNKLGVADSKQLTNQYAQGYAADYTNAVADQVQNDYITSPELLNIAQNIHNADTANKADGMRNALSLKDFEQQKDDDYIKALLQARGLSQSVHNKFAEQDLQAYTDNQNALQSMLKYEGNLELDKQKLAQEQREADQSYELSKLEYQKAKSSGGSGRSSGGLTKGSSGSDTNSENYKSKDVAMYYENGKWYYGGSANGKTAGTEIPQQVVSNFYSGVFSSKGHSVVAIQRLVEKGQINEYTAEHLLKHKGIM